MSSGAIDDKQAMEVARILLVEDDREIADVMQRTLRREGYSVSHVASGGAALATAQSLLPDLVVLDLGLPDIDGLEVCRDLRATTDTAVLMVTARDSVSDRVGGLDKGADDYLVKPFEREELLARIRALLRRRPPKGSAKLIYNDLTIDPNTRTVTRGERKIDLTVREFEVIEYFVRNANLVISRQKLLNEVWQYDPSAITNTIDVFVSHLRRKLEAGDEPRILHTVRGIGYILKEPA